MNVALLIGSFLLVAGLALHIAAVATNEWSEWSTRGFDFVNAGLWEACGAGICRDWGSRSTEYFDGKLEVAQASAIIGLLVAAIAILVLIPAFFNGKTGFPFHFVAGGMAIFAFVVIMIGDIIWAESIQDDFGKILASSLTSVLEKELGYSFALTVTGAVLILIAGIVSCLKNISVNGANPPVNPQPIKVQSMSPASNH